MLLNRHNQNVAAQNAALKARDFALVAGRTHLHGMYRTMCKRTYSPGSIPSSQIPSWQQPAGDVAVGRVCSARSVPVVVVPAVDQVVPASRWLTQHGNVPAAAWAAIAIQSALRG